jgi:glycosyltransferase involved in cell wall biosynthesis
MTRLFPNAVDPAFATFNRQQFAALGARCDVEVLATIPWFPGAGLLSRWSAAGRLLAVPRDERIAGLPVRHPRYLQLPVVGRGIADRLYVASLARELASRRGRHDVLLAAWAYPDGVAAVELAARLGIPAVVKVHGTDMNVLSRSPPVARALRRALPRAARVVAVSRPLADVVASFGVDRARIDVVTNGVDPALFHPRDRAAARAAVGREGDGLRWLLYVGRLEPAKGVLDLLDAFAQLRTRRDDVRLVVVGDGSAREACERAAAQDPRILVAGPQPLERVPLWMGACDALVLPSWAEGTPNVVLEALACGRRAVATAVGGTPDVVTAPELGELVPPREPAALAAAMGRAASADVPAAEVARAGARQGWAESAARLEQTLRRALG